MKKKVKKLLLILAVVFASLTFIALFLPYFINLNEFKPKIQAMVAEKLNAKLDFSSVRLNFLGGIGLRFKDMTLENNAKPFVGEKIFSAKDVEVEFEILPLLSHKLVSTLDLNEPTVTIIKIGSKDNISSLSKPSNDTNQKTKTDKDTKDESDDYTLVLTEVSVTNAHIVFNDLTEKASPTIIDLKDIDFDMTRENQTLNVEKLSMKLFSGQLVSHMKIDLADPQIAYRGDCELKNFSLGDIYHSFGAQKKTSPINGVATVNFTFDGRGTTRDVYSKSLNGEGHFKIKSGEFKIDTALPIILDQLGSLLTSLPIPGFNIDISDADIKKVGKEQETSISLANMQGDFEVKKGVLFLKNDIPMKQGLLKLDITIGIFTSALKGIATFAATKDFTKTLVATNKNFTYLLDKDNLFYLKIILSGTVSDPDITLDKENVLGNILLRTGKSILNPIESIPNAIENTLKNIFSP